MSRNCKKLGVVMDDIAEISPAKDTTFALLLAAASRGYELFYMNLQDLCLTSNGTHAHAQRLNVFDNADKWFELGEQNNLSLVEFDIILMRTDPPVNDSYLYATMILEKAVASGVRVINNPNALRNKNEKLFALDFPDLCPSSLVTHSIAELQAFLQDQQDIVCKPLNAMGGTSIFRVQKADVNATVIFETLTQDKQFMIAQKYIPEIVAGDKRIILINGKAIPHALSRVPQQDWRGNLAKGAQGKVQPLTVRDQEICDRIGPTLKAEGLWFVGIDVIGDYLTEINITSPTGAREIDKAFSMNICEKLFIALEENT